MLTRRNFGLTRGRSLQDAANLLQHFVSSANVGKKNYPSSLQSSPPSSGSGSSTCSSGATSPKNKFGHGGFGDRSANVWDWPLGQVRIVNEERTFEAQLAISPFAKDEITVSAFSFCPLHLRSYELSFQATVMGSELFIHCYHENNGRVREFCRSYQLPLNIEPRSVRFRFKDRRYLLVTAEKEQPLKLAVAFAPCDDDVFLF